MWKAIKDYFRAFKVLTECPREVWIMYGLTLFDSLAYFTLSYVLIKYLTDNFGFSDVAAGWVYGAWTMVISVVIFFVGAFTDTIGIKKALLVGLVLLVISRGLMAFVPALPDNQMEFKAEHLVQEWNVESYAAKVPKGMKQPKPFKHSKEKWRISQEGEELFISNQGGENFNTRIRTGYILACSDRTNYNENEKANKPVMLSKLVFSDKGEEKGAITFEGKLRSIDGEKRADWEKYSASGSLSGGAAIDLSQEPWALQKHVSQEVKDVAKKGYVDSLVTLGKAVAAGRKKVDRSKLQLKNLRMRDPEGKLYDVALHCVPDTLPEGTLGEKLKMSGSTREYSEVDLWNEEKSKSGMLSFTGILTDVYGNEVTMWKINTAKLTWDKHPSLAGNYIPDNIKDKGKELPKMFFWSKGNFSAMAALICGMFVLALGTALMSPVILTAKKYYTNSRTRTTVFMVYYLMVNIAAMLSGVVVDMLRLPFGNQSIFVFGFFMVFVSYILVQFFLREGIDEEEIERLEKVKKRQAAGEEVDPKELEDRRQKPPTDLRLWPVIKEIGNKLWTVMRESTFWRYILFLLVILGVRLIFTHWFMVMPKYYTRILGEGVPIGTLNMLNPFMISVGLIIAMPLINKIRIYPCFILGTSISAISMIFLMIPGDSFAWLGLDTWQGYFLIVFLQIFVFSIGEVIWSPRTGEYAANIAPGGQVGTYMSLAALLLFISKPVNGLLSGWLLDDYCAEGAYEQIYYEGGFSYWEGPEVMWVIYGAIAISSPLLLVVLRNVIQPKHLREQSEHGNAG